LPGQETFRLRKALIFWAISAREWLFIAKHVIRFLFCARSSLFKCFKRVLASASGHVCCENTRQPSIHCPQWKKRAHRKLLQTRAAQALMHDCVSLRIVSYALNDFLDLSAKTPT